MSHSELSSRYALELAGVARTFGDAAVISVGAGSALATAFTAGMAVMRDATLADDPTLVGWKAELELPDGTLVHCCYGPTAAAAAGALYNQLLGVPSGAR
ncbi:MULTISPECIES: hypothetical protein [Mycolicibacter]|uniref:Uncharacterized protein n=2 Tax=Mycolicibacter TaxID=1073531 RepID=A0ABU5XL09_9MYCO|nr:MULTISPECIES: hypothetical protein [unclassified Mycolicibacter]MEB3022970.1 hypothetical protein [Mycolicibacter sp. MYC098]MEB3033480.1 hypothetical protein [Mycolicibacter sp. MYC340]